MAPYLRVSRTTFSVMTHVCIALVPPCVAAVYVFGWQAAVRIALSVAVACAADRLCCHGKRFNSAAVVTGLLLTLSLPVGIPLWLLAAGCVFAVCVMRDAFGGIGNNLFNPAMAARAVLLTVFPAHLTGYTSPDAVSAATPLATAASAADLSSVLPLLVGTVGGSMGETSALMILLGAVWLFCHRIIRWRIPVFSLLSFAAFSLITAGHVVKPLLSGSILFGAVYIFTDYTGKHTTPKGEILFAIGVGATTALLRAFGHYPEGVCFAVLLWNLLTPLLESATVPHLIKRRKRA